MTIQEKLDLIVSMLDDQNKANSAIVLYQISQLKLIENLCSVHLFENKEQMMLELKDLIQTTKDTYNNLIKVAQELEDNRNEAYPQTH